MHTLFRNCYPSAKWASPGSSCKKLYLENSFSRSTVDIAVGSDFLSNDYNNDLIAIKTMWTTRVVCTAFSTNDPFCIKHSQCGSLKKKNFGTY